MQRVVLGANATMAEVSTRLDALQRALEQIAKVTTLDAEVRAAIVKLLGIREQLNGDNTPGRYSEPTETSLRTTHVITATADPTMRATSAHAPARRGTIVHRR